MEQNIIQDDLAIIVLAAGSSSRLGQSKQLLTVDGEPLLLKSVNVAILSGVKKVIVVLGANENIHRPIIEKLPIEIIYNSTWQKGMGHSLKVGLTHLLSIESSIEAIIVIVCDQPLVTSSHLKNIIELHTKTKNPIVASFYSGMAGVPALFEKSLFKEMLSISDEHGAKKIIQQHPDLVATINFPEGAIDIDTREDLINFIP